LLIELAAAEEIVAKLTHSDLIQCVPLAGSPGKCWFTKRTKVHVILVMKCGCVFWEFAKRKLATRKDKIKIINTQPATKS
jgi:hypothetical protein